MRQGKKRNWIESFRRRIVLGDGCHLSIFESREGVLVNWGECRCQRGSLTARQQGSELSVAMRMSRGWEKETPQTTGRKAGDQGLRSSPWKSKRCRKKGNQLPVHATAANLSDIHPAEQRKPAPKEHILSNLIYIKFKTKLIWVIETRRVE